MTKILILKNDRVGDLFNSLDGINAILKDNRDNKIEIRRYKEHITASVTFDNKEEFDKRAFRTLADYIFGNNSRNEEIPMTAPVFSQTKDNNTTMMFYMPSYFTSLQELPKPNNRRVKLSVKAAQIDEEKSLIAKFGEGATKSGATLKGIFEKAIGKKGKKEK